MNPELILIIKNPTLESVLEKFQSNETTWEALNLLSRGIKPTEALLKKVEECQRKTGTYVFSVTKSLWCERIADTFYEANACYVFQYSNGMSKLVEIVLELKGYESQDDDLFSWTVAERFIES